MEQLAEELDHAMKIKFQERVFGFLDLKDVHVFEKKLENLMEYHNFLLREYFHEQTIDLRHVTDEILSKYEKISRIS